MTRLGMKLFVLPAVGLTLAACGNNAGDQASSTPSQPTVTTTATKTASATSTQTTTASGSSTGGSSATTSSAPGGCGTMSMQEAFQSNARKVPAPETTPGAEWMLPSEGIEQGYDPCAPLSWIVVSIKGATASSPYAIMLFHNGEYLGTATKKQYGNQPKVVRQSPNSIQVTYLYPKKGDANAKPTGEAVSTFTYDESQGKVVQAGELPPES